MRRWEFDDGMRQEWRRAWPLPLVSAVGYGVGAAYSYSFGLFIVPLKEEFGWSRAAITGGLLVAGAINVFLASFVGLLIDKWGVRRIAIPGMFFYCAALAALGFSGPVVAFWWAQWIFVGLASLAVNSTIWTTAVVSRFDRSRGLALAIALCGGGLAAIFVPLLTNALLVNFGWRETYFVFGGILAAVSIPLLMLFFRDQRDVDRRFVASGGDVQTTTLVGYSLGEALRSSRYVRLTLATTLTILAVTAMLINLVPILGSRSVTGSTAAGIAGLVGIGSIIGRLSAGFLLDRISGPLIGAISFAMPILVAYALLAADTSLAGAAALLLGLTLGTELDVIGYITSRYFGMRCFGAIFGSIVGMMGLALGLGPVIGSLVYDHFGSYDWLLIGVMPVCALSSLMILSLGRYPVFEAQPAGLST